MLPLATAFAQRVVAFLDVFRLLSWPWHAHLTIKTTIPIAAGFASSACGFAALVLALNQLFTWGLTPKELSILARLGSGSATRSFWRGFVIWHAGERADGMDSYGEPLAITWPTFCVGLLTINAEEKPLSSRVAMQCTQHTSPFYAAWVKQAHADLAVLQQAIQTRNFVLLGETAESNALAMHASMLASRPVICYSLPETLSIMQHIWLLRQRGTAVYFTQDAGPNLKLLFEIKDAALMQTLFPNIVIEKIFVE